MKKIFFFGLAFFGLKIILNKIKLYNQLEVDFKNISIGGGLLNPELILTLNLKNPTKAVANLQAINGRLFLINGTYIGDVNLIENRRIYSSSNVDINLKIQGFNTTLINILLNLQTSLKLEIKFDGFLTVDGLQFPLNFIKKIV